MFGTKLPNIGLENIHKLINTGTVTPWNSALHCQVFAKLNFSFDQYLWKDNSKGLCFNPITHCTWTVLNQICPKNKWNVLTYNEVSFHV